MDWVPAATVQTTIGVGGFFSIDGAGRTGHDYCFPRDILSDGPV